MSGEEGGGVVCIYWSLTQSSGSFSVTNRLIKPSYGVKVKTNQILILCSRQEYK